MVKGRTRKYIEKSNKTKTDQHVQLEFINRLVSVFIKNHQWYGSEF